METPCILFAKSVKDLRFEKWSAMMDGDGVSGTIRTIPENYYVATVTSDKKLVFEGLEAMTRGVNKKTVRRWFKSLKE